MNLIAADAEASAPLGPQFPSLPQFGTPQAPDEAFEQSIQN